MENKKSINLAGFLAGVAGVSALILSLINNITSPIIQEAAIAAERVNLQILFNNDESFAKIDADFGSSSSIQDVYSVSNDGSVVGYVYKVNVQGYSAPISFLVAIDTSDNYKGIAVLELNDTAGIGTRAAEPEFTDQFNGNSIDDGIDLITGVTVTTEAMRNGIDEAVKHYRENF